MNEYTVESCEGKKINKKDAQRAVYLFRKMLKNPITKQKDKIV
ncbi:hypothetical protein ACFL2G_01560 [Candidatus Omnitrophota bacterium]